MQQFDSPQRDPRRGTPDQFVAPHQRPRYFPLPPEPEQPPTPPSPRSTGRFVAGILLLVALALGIAFREEIAGAFGSIREIGGYSSRSDQTLGLIMVGLIGVIVVAVVRILVAHEQRRGG